ncbi:MAG: hypothetical protein J6P57_00515 [Lachnospiraceae bacterium]|nr:hypothetical protein [Lachnospiraceae bacterium]
MDIKDYFRKNRKCVISGITAAALLGCSCFAGTALRPIDTFNYEQEVILAENEEAEGETITADSVANDLTSKFGIRQKDVNKDETVYAFAEADGSVNNIVVSEWLRNTDKKSEIKDKTDLKDIENVKGDEAFSQNGDEITWQANGNDIYYQGTTDRELPVSVKVTYYLDGKETKAEDMAGVSGNVKIRFDYTNNTDVEKDINGKKEKIKIPFVAISGLILNENCKNVVVDNGKTMPQGASTIVIGYAVPGIKDSLGLEDADLSEDLSLPDYFEVSADVTDFSLDMTMTAVVSASEFSFGGDIDTSELDGMINEMSEAGDALTDGSKKLADGTSTLLTKMGEFTTGAKQLATGVSQVKSGADQVSTGANQLAAGAGQLKNGVDVLVSSSDSLATGVNAINDGAATVNQSAASISQGVAALDAGLNAPMSDEQKKAVADEAVAGVNKEFAAGTDTYNYIYNTAVNSFTDKITNPDTVDLISSQVSAGIKANTDLNSAIVYALEQQAYADYLIYNHITADQVPFSTFVDGLDPDNLAKMQQGAAAVVNSIADPIAQSSTNQITSGIVAAGADETGKSVVAACQQAAGQAAGQAAVAGAEGAKKTIAGQIEAVGDTGYSLVTGTQALAAGSQTLADGTQTLTDKIPSLTAGIGQLSDGADQLASGSSQLATGSSQLATGTTQLVDGSNKLATGSEQLQDGVKQLADGADELSSGMNEFNNAAIKKIVEAYNGDIKDIAGRLDAVLEASSEYQTFTEINDGDTGVTKFIIKTNGITE